MASRTPRDRAAPSAEEEQWFLRAAMKLLQESGGLQFTVQDVVDSAVRSPNRAATRRRE